MYSLVTMVTSPSGHSAWLENSPVGLSALCKSRRGDHSAMWSFLIKLHIQHFSENCRSGAFSFANPIVDRSQCRLGEKRSSCIMDSISFTARNYNATQRSTCYVIWWPFDTQNMCIVDKTTYNLWKYNAGYICDIIEPMLQSSMKGKFVECLLCH